MTSNRRVPAAFRTSVLATVLALAGTAAALAAPAGRLLRMAPAAPAPVLFCCFVLAFLCAEIALVHLELRRQTYSFSLSGIAMVLGVLFTGTRELVLARVIGALLVFGWQRLPVLKAFYNASAYTLEAALVGLTLHHLLGPGTELGLASAGICLLTFGVADLLMSSLVLLVISWHQSGVSWGQAASAYLSATVLGFHSTVAAIAIVALLDEGAVGAVLITVFAVVVVVLYRGYLILRRRHQSLSVVHEFVQQGVGAVSVQELSEALLLRTRRLLNAGEVELVVDRPSGEARLRIDENDAFAATEDETAGSMSGGDWLLTRVRQNTEAIVIPRGTKEKGLRHWLTARQARDAMIVPLESGTFSGVLIVQDRLGDASTFTADDLRLLETLAGHVVIALRGTQLVQQLRHDATHDALTGLGNRVLLTQRIQEALRERAEDDTVRSLSAEPEPEQTAVRPAVLLLDLDKFKEVNDTLGHHVGDALLRVLGQRITNCAPDLATVARLGGDEFAILMPAATQQAAEQLARTVLATVGSPIALHEATLNTGASIGIALGAPGQSGADLLRHADTAMYAAKAGTDPVVVYTEELDRGRAERLSLLADLHLALERDEIELRYQPQLDLLENRVVSVEALVRWRHPSQGLLGPDEFIHLAESSGLIDELTRQVLRKALRQCRQWRDEGLDLTMAVNISAHNVNNANLTDDVASALAEARLPADRLVLEITESTVMGDAERTVPILQRLADIGVTLSLDDFGTGYSSLAYLQRLPVSELKIDRSFVMGLAAGGEAHASSVLVRSMITLGANLGLRVVAEGVEDEHALRMLRDLGCDLAQGFYLAHPLTPTAVADLLVDPAMFTGQHLAAVAS